jgi:hypothetical protein
VPIILLDNFDKLLDLVKKQLESKKTNSQTAVAKKETDSTTQSDAMNYSAFQELYELTQRKFLKQIVKYCADMSTPRECPRLFCIDFISLANIPSIEKFKFSSSITYVLRKSNEEDSSPNNTYLPCIRVLCEHEEGWHLSDSLIVLPDHLNYIFDSTALKKTASYLARIVNILKSGSLSSEMQIFLSDEGQQLITKLEKPAETVDLSESYTTLREHFINEYFKEKRLVVLSKKEEFSDETDLKRCELKNGKVLWLCANHIESTKARVLKDTDISNANVVDSDFNQMLEFIHEFDEVEAVHKFGK